MSATTKSTKRPRRKTAKRYDQVTFTLDFIDGEIQVPSFAQVPTGVQRKTMGGDVNVLADFLTEHASAGVVELFDDLDGTEIQDFMNAWAKASGLDLGE